MSKKSRSNNGNSFANNAVVNNYSSSSVHRASPHITYINDDGSVKRSPFVAKRVEYKSSSNNTNNNQSYATVSNIEASRQCLNVSHKIIYGNDNVVTGNHNTVVGDRNIVTGNHASVFGEHCTVTGNHAFIQGDFALLTGNHCTIEGMNMKGMNGNHNRYSIIRTRRAPSLANSTNNNNSSSSSNNNVYYYDDNSDSSIFNNDDTSTIVLSKTIGHQTITISTAAETLNSATPSSSTRSKKRKLSPAPPPVISSFDTLDETHDERSTEGLPAQFTCNVCMDNLRKVLYLPCNHMRVCIQCTKALYKMEQPFECPACRAVVESVSEVI